MREAMQTEQPDQQHPHHAFLALNWQEEVSTLAQIQLSLRQTQSPLLQTIQLEVKLFPLTPSINIC